MTRQEMHSRALPGLLLSAVFLSIALPVLFAERMLPGLSGEAENGSRLFTGALPFLLIGLLLWLLHGRERAGMPKRRFILGGLTQLAGVLMTLPGIPWTRWGGLILLQTGAMLVTVAMIAHVEKNMRWKLSLQSALITLLYGNLAWMLPWQAGIASEQRPSALVWLPALLAASAMCLWLLRVPAGGHVVKGALLTNRALPAPDPSELKPIFCVSIAFFIGSGSAHLGGFFFDSQQAASGSLETGTLFLIPVVLFISSAAVRFLGRSFSVFSMMASGLILLTVLLVMDVLMQGGTLPWPVMLSLWALGTSFIMITLMVVLLQRSADVSSIGGTVNALLVALILGYAIGTGSLQYFDSVSIDLPRILCGVDLVFAVMLLGIHNAARRLGNS